MRALQLIVCALLLISAFGDAFFARRGFWSREQRFYLYLDCIVKISAILLML